MVLKVKNGKMNISPNMRDFVERIETNVRQSANKLMDLASGAVSTQRHDFEDLRDNLIPDVGDCVSLWGRTTHSEKPEGMPTRQVTANLFGPATATRAR